MPRCFRIHPLDNVATMLDDAAPGPVQLLGGDSSTIQLLEPIKIGHKIALADIPPDGPILKFGVPIGHASQPIRSGQWIHLHNLKSNFDERSSTLDNETGAPTDTPYARLFVFFVSPC